MNLSVTINSLNGDITSRDTEIADLNTQVTSLTASVKTWKDLSDTQST